MYVKEVILHCGTVSFFKKSSLTFLFSPEEIFMHSISYMEICLHLLVYTEILKLTDLSVEFNMRADLWILKAGYLLLTLYWYTSTKYQYQCCKKRQRITFCMNQRQFTFPQHMKGNLFTKAILRSNLFSEKFTQGKYEMKSLLHWAHLCLCTTILQFRRMYVPRKQVDTIKSSWSPSSWDKHKTIILLRQHISEMADPENPLLPPTHNK